MSKEPKWAKIHVFDPSLNLRFRKRNFIIDDKIVATKSELQYKDSADHFDWWSTVGMTEELVHVKDNDELWSGYGVKI